MKDVLLLAITEHLCYFFLDKYISTILIPRFLLMYTTNKQGGEMNNGLTWVYYCLSIRTFWQQESFIGILISAITNHLL